MATDDGSGSRDRLVAALTAELGRQGATGLDIAALADAVEAASAPLAPADEGKHPDQLNATNDD